MWKLPKNLGMLTLAGWLIASGLVGLGVITFPEVGRILAVVAIAAGVLLILGK